MLGTLTIKNCFKHQDSKFDFAQGLTAITGANFKGKSQILEMIRFALFGSAALRTNATDYKGAKVTLTFGVKGLDYYVERTTTNAKLLQGQDQLASGTRPVNEKILQIFGYGLTVFDTANVATQGKIEALGNMRAAERKQLIDSTVGLNVLDDLIKWCTDERSLKQREAETIAKLLTKPVEPIKPDGYLPLESLKQAHVNLSKLQAERNLLLAKLKAEPKLPDKPIETETRSISDLMTIQGHRDALAAQIQKLNQQYNTFPPPPPISLKTIEEEEKYISDSKAQSDAVKFMNDYPEPKYTHEQLEEFRDALLNCEQFDAWHNLNKLGHHECPKCHHKWPIHENQMRHLGDWENRPPPTKPPVKSIEEISQHRNILAAYERTKLERVQHKLILVAFPLPLMPPPKYNLENLKRYRRAWEEQDRREEIGQLLISLINEFKTIPDVNDALKIRREYEQAVVVYDGLCAVRQRWEQDAIQWRARIEEIGDIDPQITGLLGLLVAVQAYDTAYAAYKDDLARYQAQNARYEAIQAEIEDYSKARQALMLLKSRIKSYLVPSLSRVASILVGQMTNGALNDIQISEDFDVWVNGVTLDGLSGCGKATANLALRLGLGQVLTNQVFPVFMADEIDAAMDNDNAEATHQCLQRLTKSISQVVLVSHKKPVADNYIEL